MTVLVYDGSFEGLFTAVFEVFEFKYHDCEIVPQNQNTDFLFGEKHSVVTDFQKAERVLKRLLKQTRKDGLNIFIDAYLSGEAGVEKYILAAINYAVENPKKDILQDFGHPAVLKLAQISRSVQREKHRMLGFVRFEKYSDEVYVSTIEPDFNVLPLIVGHFTDRFRDQKWVLYDLKRKYGYYYDLQQISEIFLENLNPDKTHPEEDLYTKLWQHYFKKTSIEERKNAKLHTQHVPKRYWKYLTEKK